MKNRFLKGRIFSTLVLVMSGPAAYAVPHYWDGGTVNIASPGNSASSGGAGSWSTAISNWDTGVGAHVAWPNSGTDNDAILGGTTAGIVNITSNVSANDLTFTTTGYTVARTTTSVLTLNGTTATITNGTSISATISSVIGGVVGTTVSKAGAGTLTLSGVNTYAGPTTITEGILKVGNATALGAQTSATNGTTVSSGASLDLGGTATGVAAERLTVSGSGVGGAGAVFSSAAIATPFIGVRYMTLAGDTTLGFVNRWDVGSTTAANNGFVGGGYTLNIVGSLAGQASFNFLGDTDLGDINLNLGNAATAIMYLQGTTTLGRSANTMSITGGSTLDIFTTSSVTSFDKKFALDNGKITVEKTGAVSLPGTISLTNSNTITASSATVAITSSNSISGTGSLVKAGNGSLTLSGSNSYGGTTSVNVGTLSIASAAALPGYDTNGRFSVASGATLTVQSGVLDSEIASILATTNFVSGSILGIDTSGGSRTVATNLGSGSPVILSKVGGNTLTLSGTNNYTGATVFTAGTLQFANPGALYNGNTASWTPANISVPSGTTLAVNFGGGSDFSESQANTLITNLSTINTNGLRAGANFGFDTTNAAGSVTYGQVLANPTGTGSGALGISKLGTGTLVLDQANTYTGPTNVIAGTLTLTGNRTVVAGALNVGTAGSNGTLNLQGDFLLAGGNNFIGQGAGGTGTVNQSAGNVAFNTNTVLFFGGGGTVSNYNTGAFNLSGGTLGNGASTGFVSMGVNSYSNNGFTLSNTGILNLPSGALHLGRAGRNDVGNTNNTFTQSGGSATVGTLLVGGDNDTNAVAVAVNGVMNLTGGTFIATNFANFARGRESISSITIGGTAQVTLPKFPILRGTGASATVTFDGGTLTPLVADVAYMSDLTKAYLTSTGANFNVPLGRDISVAQAFEDAPSNAGAFTKSGAGILVLSGTSTYTGPTLVNAGTLNLKGAGLLSGTSGLSVASGAKFTYTPTSPGTLTLGTSGTLTLADGSSIGADFGSTIVVPGAASITGAVNLAISGAFISGTSYTLLSAASGLDSGAFNILNPVDYSFVKTVTATAVEITPTSLTPLTSAYWVGGLGGSSRIWAASNGSSASNWASDSSGTATPLVPGSGANVIFSAAGALAGNQVSMTLGADMAVNGLTFTSADPTSLINGGPSVLTIGGGGITVNSGTAGVTLEPGLVVGSSQNWVNDSSNTLMIGGTVTNGVNPLTIAGTGATNIASFNAGTGGLTVSSGTTTVTSTSLLGAQTWVNNGVMNLGSLTNNGNVFSISGTGATAVTGTISGSGALSKTGSGTLTLTGSNTYTGITTVGGGTLIAAGGSVSSANTVVGNSTDNAALYVPSGGTLNGGTISVGTTAGSNGALNVTGGTLSFVTPEATDGISFGAAGYGAFTMSSGSFTQQRLMFGGTGTTSGTGVGLITGGTYNNSGWFILSRVGTSTGILTITGGTINHANASQAMSLGLGGSGRAELNIAGGLIDNTGRNTTFAYGTGGTFHWSGTGLLNLAAGTLTTNSIFYDTNAASSSASSYVNFSGGTLKAAVSTTTFLPAFTPDGSGTNRVFVNGAFGTFAGGANIDTNGFDATVSANLLAPSGDGVKTMIVSDSGSGYIGAPAVQILEGGLPTTATAYAVIGTDPLNGDTFGKIVSVAITNPGVISNLGNVTVSLIGGGGTGGAITVTELAANTSGGLAKLGAGTLTLTGINSYTGATSISAGGTLELGNGTNGNDGTISNTSGIVNNGSLVYNTFSNLSSDRPISGTGSLIKRGAGVQTLTAANSYGGTTTISGGSLQAGNDSAFSTGSVSIAGGVRLFIGSGITIANPIIIGANAGTSGNGLIQVNTGTGTITGPITINNTSAAGGHFASGGTGILRVDGVITSSVPVLIRIGSVVMSGGGTGYTSIVMGAGTHSIGENNGIATTAVLTIATSSPSTFDLGGFNQELAGLTRTSSQTAVVTTTTGSSTLTLNVAGATSQSYGGEISGAVSLVKNGTGTQVLSGINTYSGNTTVSAGTLELTDNAQLKFVLGATSGSNNTLTGAGTVTLNGDFAIDTTAADSLSSGTWTLENASSLTGAYGSTFSVVGFTDAGDNKWTKANGAKTYTFDETTGILTLSQPGYASWIDGFFPAETNPAIIGAGADPDFDGIANAVEMVIGGDPKLGMDTALLPTLELVTDPVGSPAIPDGDYLLFTYRRSDLSVGGGVSADCETDIDLAGVWTSSTGAPGVVIQVDDNFTFTPAAAADTDRVRVYIPRAADTTLFGRLKVVVP
jgi:fibronectin-binding autotransporter adhesin